MVNAVVVMDVLGKMDEEAVMKTRIGSTHHPPLMFCSFQNQYGPCIHLGDPTETFLALFTPDLLDNIVRETNRYAEQYLQHTRVMNLL